MSLNSLLDKAISVANVAGKKTEEMVKASKLKLQEVSVNADLQDCSRGRLSSGIPKQKERRKTTNRQSNSWSSRRMFC